MTLVDALQRTYPCVVLLGRQFAFQQVKTTLPVTHFDLMPEMRGFYIILKPGGFIHGIQFTPVTESYPQLMVKILRFFRHGQRVQNH
jgi:hypothetical protein